MKLTRDIITKVISCCNRDLVPDSNFKESDGYHSDWFKSYFSFLNKEPIAKHLGEAFYQARFTYKLMASLRLPVFKHSAMVKFQIIQYASICEALLQEAIETYYKSDFEKRYAIKEYILCSNAVSKDVKITNAQGQLYMCKLKEKKADIKRERIDHKTEFACEKGIISKDTKDNLDKLYDLRNNIHILKAVQNNYVPKLYESKNAFLLMQKMVEEVKKYYNTHPIDKN